MTPADSTSLLGRIPQHIGRKLMLLVILPPLFNLCYFLPQWVSLFEPARIPLTAIDRAVPFDPWWIFLYMSMYLMLPLAPMLAIRTEHFRRYTVGLTIMFVSGCVCFFLYPVAYDRPPLPPDSPGFYRLIVTIDRPINSIPSLHAGLTVYTLLFATRALADLPARRRRALLMAGSLWGAVILYGTLATKQHYLLDLPPGALLAWVSHRLAWRSSCEVARDAATVLKGERHAILVD